MSVVFLRKFYRISIVGANEKSQVLVLLMKDGLETIRLHNANSVVTVKILEVIKYERIFKTDVHSFNRTAVHYEISYQNLQILRRRS